MKQQTFNHFVNVLFTNKLHNLVMATFCLFVMMPFMTQAQTVLPVATAFRVYVSAQKGSDLSTCGATATPCKTIQMGLQRIKDGGEVIVMDSGSHGAITIDKPASIIAEPGVYANITVSSGAAVTVQHREGFVLLKGLTIQGMAQSYGDPTLGGVTGIHFVSNDWLTVEDCVISGFRGAGIYADNFNILTVKDSILRDNGGTAIESRDRTGSRRGKSMVTVEHCQLERNGHGLYAGSTTAVIRDSVVTGNRDVGVQAEHIYGRLTVDNCLVNNNGRGVYADGGDAYVEVYVTRSTVSNNVKGLIYGGNSALISLGNNLVINNGSAEVFSKTISQK